MKPVYRAGRGRRFASGGRSRRVGSHVRCGCKSAATLCDILALVLLCEDAACASSNGEAGTLMATSLQKRGDPITVGSEVKAFSKLVIADPREIAASDWLSLAVSKSLTRSALSDLPCNFSTLVDQRPQHPHFVESTTAPHSMIPRVRRAHRLARLSLRTARPLPRFPVANDVRTAPIAPAPHRSLPLPLPVRASRPPSTGRVAALAAAWSVPQAIGSTYRSTHRAAPGGDHTLAVCPCAQVSASSATLRATRS